MKKIPDAIINKIRLLRRDGSSFKEIARKLGLGSSTTYKYGARCKISKAGMQKLRDKVTKQRLEFVKKFAVLRPVKFPKSFSNGLVRVIAYCFFDRSVSSSSVNYKNSSVHLVNQFINDIREVFHIEPSLIRFYRGKFPFIIKFTLATPCFRDICILIPRLTAHPHRTRESLNRFLPILI